MTATHPTTSYRLMYPTAGRMNQKPDKNEIYRKFGETAEVAQLLETELGTLLIEWQAQESGLLEKPDPETAKKIVEQVNRKTLGQLLRSLQGFDESIDRLEPLLLQALKERNRLNHSFYIQHNLRINSHEGRELMLQDLEKIHEELFLAYKELMKISGFDLDELTVQHAKATALASIFGIEIELDDLPEHLSIQT